LAGLATSAVLLARLRRAAALAAAVPLDRPDIDQPAWAALLDAVTVQETRLFRSPAQLAELREAVLPERFAAAAAEGRPLRLLSAGCATGEEAWSLAALALDAAGPGRGRPATAAIEVTGIDICRAALAAARAATYRGPPDPLRSVPPGFHRWFEATAGQVVPAAPLRAVTGFRRANLLRLVEREAQYDVILWRNVGIYFTPAARQTTLEGLVRVLRPGGALLLGPTDQVTPGLPLTPWTPGAFALLRRLDGHD
jgi:chemotaxis protein methyltransferase CheR